MKVLGKSYLGDGAYVGHDEHGAIWLTTSNGIEDTNVICLEPDVLGRFLAYVTRFLNPPKVETPLPPLETSVDIGCSVYDEEP